MLTFTVRLRVIGNKLSVQAFGVRGNKGAQWERNRAKKEGGWISVKESPPTTDGLYFTKGGFRKYNIMYFRDGKFFTHRHSDTYDSGIEFYKPVEN